jgi:hypothetical protein
MSFRTTGVLVAVLLILGGIVYYLMQQPAPSTATTTKQPAVVTFTPGDATKLVISAADKTTELDKSGDTWTIGKPQAGPADATRVQGWIDQFGNLTADRAIDNVSDFGTYGLTQPKMNVQIALQGGKTVNLQFGNKTPDGGDYYVRVPDDSTKASSVYLVGVSLGDDLNSALTKPPVALPTPTPLPTLVPGTIVPPSKLTTTPDSTVTPAG